MASNDISASQLSNLAKVSQAAARYLPEPAVGGLGSFGDVLRTVGGVGTDLLGGAADVVSGGDFGELLSLQMEAQKELQSTTMVSNVERSKHESKMAAIRNIRVS